MTWRFIQFCGAALAVLCILGLAGDWDNAAMTAVVQWIEQTNAYYDGIRIWISLLVLSVFMIWAGGYLNRHHSRGQGIQIARAPVLVAACVLVSPVYLLDHKGVLPGALFAEDGVMEYLTVALLFASAALAVLAIRRGGFDRAERIMLILFAGGLAFLAMEEISWGQRIFGIETPEALRAANVQGEINLHNLTVGWNEIVRMVLACVISAVLILIPRDAVPGLGGRLDRLKPDTRFLPLIPLLIASHVYDEWFEQIVSYAIFSYALMIHRRAER
ncbi:MAG: hypothetical protein RIM33_01360 [Alphaproteobacteria bacterium]